MKTYLTAGLSLLLTLSQMPACAKGDDAAHKGTLETVSAADQAEALKKGDQLMDHGKFRQAADAFREAIRTQPDNPKAHSRLGAAMAASHDEHEAMGDKTAAQNDYETAILEEKQAMKLDANYSAPHIILGQIYANQGKSAEAIAEFKQALQIKPNNFTANLDLGIAYIGTGEVDNAIAAFKEAERIKPDHPIPHMQLGILLDKRGNHKEGINEELEAIKLDGHSHDAYINLGNIYLDSNDLDNAKDAFEHGLKLAPGHPNALSGLGWALAQKGFVKEGIAKERAAIKSYYGFLPAHTRLAKLLAQSGDKQGAEAEYQIALKISPKHVGAITEYADFLAKNGKTAEAKEQFKKALEINHDFAPAKQGLASLENAK